MGKDITLNYELAAKADVGWGRKAYNSKWIIKIYGVCRV